MRLFLPPTAHLRYQLWVGRYSEGPRECLPDRQTNVEIGIVIVVTLGVIDNY